MIEREEDKVRDVKESLKAISSESVAVEGHLLGRGGASSIGEDPISASLSPSNTAAKHMSCGELPKSTGKSSYGQSAVPPGPSQTLIIQSTDLRKMPVTREKQSASNTALRKTYSSHSLGLSPDSLEMESPRDLEKLSLGQQCPCPESSYFASAHSTDTANVYDNGIAEDDDPARHATRILVIETAPPCFFQ